MLEKPILARMLCFVRLLQQCVSSPAKHHWSILACFLSIGNTFSRLFLFIYCRYYIMSLFIISRYFKICHSNLYQKIFTFRNTILFCLTTWLIALFLEFGNIFEWGGHYFDAKTLNCVWNRLASHSFSIFFPMSSIIIPCVCILFCYIRIFMFASNSKVSRALPTKKKEFSRSIRIAKGLFASFLLYSICWSVPALYL